MPLRVRYESSFIQSCENNTNGASATYCSCAANYLTANYNETQLKNLSTSVEAGGNPSQELAAAEAACTTEADYRNNFMSNCTSNGGSYTKCSCALTYLSNNYTLEQRAQMDIDYKSTKQIPEALTSAVECLFFRTVIFSQAFACA